MYTKKQLDKMICEKQEEIKSHKAILEDLKDKANCDQLLQIIDEAECQLDCMLQEKI